MLVMSFDKCVIIGSHPAGARTPGLYLWRCPAPPPDIVTTGSCVPDTSVRRLEIGANVLRAEYL